MLKYENLKFMSRFVELKDESGILNIPIKYESCYFFPREESILRKFFE